MEALRGLGFDEVFNYKTTEVAAALDKAVPEGIDVYWVRGVVCCGLLRVGKVSLPFLMVVIFNGTMHIHVYTRRTTSAARRWTRCCPG